MAETGTEHYFTRAPSGTATPREVPLEVDGRVVTLVTAGGVFSAERVDPGTRVLLEHAPPPPRVGSLLDLGCGYGPIACAIALRRPEASVVAVDVNERALALTAENARRLSLENVAVEVVYLVGATPGPEHAKVGKTGLGTEHSVPLRRAETLGAVVPEVRAGGCSVVALELASAAVPLSERDFGDAVCLVIGNEGHGLPPAALSLCDGAVYIPQPGKVASLNVATATSIGLYAIRAAEWSRDIGAQK